MAADRHLGFMVSIRETTYYVSLLYGGLYHCTRFGSSRLSSFDNIEVW